jgi:chromosome segregation ATPase
LKDSEALPEDLDALKPPPQEKMEEQKKAYMEEAKRFKEDDALKNAVKEELARRMSSDALQEEILSYEQSQKEHYEEELQAQLKVHEDLINRKNTLEQEVNLSRNLAYNIEELKTKPEAIFSRIADFEEAVNWTQEAEKKQETLKQENETLIKEADDVRDDETKKLPKASGE